MCLAPDTDAPLHACPRAQSGAQLTVANVWAASEFVEDGVMSQVGFGLLCERLQLEQMTFEAAFFMFSICPNIEDPMVVCSSKSDLQRAVDSLGCRALSEVPAKLRVKRESSHMDYGSRFRPFFAWMFELGKAIAAMNSNACSTVVRTVPLSEGLPLMECALGPWPLLPKLKAFCLERFAPQPFSKDLWMQIGRFAEMVRPRPAVPSRARAALATASELARAQSGHVHASARPTAH